MSSSGPGALELYCHEVTVRFLEKAVVPPYEGSMIRGAFGRAFKESCCPFPHDNGAGCPLGDKCPYGYVFETSPPEDAREFAKNREVPRPYVFEPPDGNEDGVRTRRKDALRLHRRRQGGGVHALLYLRVLEDGGGGDRPPESQVRAGAGGGREPTLGDAGRGLRRRDGEEQEADHILGGCRERCQRARWMAGSAWSS